VLGLRVVVVGGLVEDLGHVGEHEESVGEALGDPELPLVLGGQHVALPLPERGRAAPQVHRHVEDLALDDANQLPLWKRQLVVKAAQHPARRPAVVVLHEGHGAGERLRERPLVVALEEEAAGVAEHLRLDDHDVRDPGGGDLHQNTFCSRRPRR
jgi:hypothetical protein